MDDKFIYYLVIGAIYLVSRLLKKKKPTAPVPPITNEDEGYEDYSEPVSQKPASPRPSSFEDLLKEISQEFEGRKEPKPTTQVVEPVINIEPTPKKEELTREQKYVNKKQKEAAEVLEQKKLLKLAEEEDKHDPHPVLELLNEEGGAANAVVLAEILNRRF